MITKETYVYDIPDPNDGDIDPFEWDDWGEDED
jgi:hypothetical protein